MEQNDEEYPLISVIITAKNEEKMIELCINSIFKQSYSNFEIIYIDAESSDKTFEIASKLRTNVDIYKNCKRFICLKKNANSPGKGRNIGAKLSNGKFIAFTDADCIAENNWLEELFKHLDHINSVVGGPNIIKHHKTSKIINAIDKVLGTYLGSAGAPQFLQIDNIKQVYGIPGCNLSLSKEIFDKLNGFDESLRYNEDTDLCYRLTKNNCKIIFNPNAIVHHYMGLDSFKEFSKFSYNYGYGRGSNIQKNSKLFSKIHMIALLTIFSIISLSILSFFIKDSLIVLSIILSICFVMIFVNSLVLSIKNRSMSLFVLSFFIIISEYLIYNIGFIYGIANLRKNRLRKFT